MCGKITTIETHLWHLKIETRCWYAYEWGNYNSFFGETRILFDACVKTYCTILALDTYNQTNNQNIENDPYTRIAFMVHAYAHPYTYDAHTSDGNVERVWLTCVLCMAKHSDCVWCDRTLLLLSYRTILSCYALRYPHETLGAQLNRLERAMR